MSEFSEELTSVSSTDGGVDVSIAADVETVAQAVKEVQQDVAVLDQALDGFVVLGAVGLLLHDAMLSSSRRVGAFR